MSDVRNGGFVILLTFCVALMLSIIPLPDEVRVFRPQWVTLTLIYWCIALPHRVGVGSGFVVGIILDVLTGTLIGQHALGLSIVAFLSLQLHQRIRVFPLWQQSLGVAVLLVIEHLLALWIKAISGIVPPGLEYWAVPVIGATLWPWMFVVLRHTRRHFKVN